MEGQEEQHEEVFVTVPMEEDVEEIEESRDAEFQELLFELKKLGVFVLPVSSVLFLLLYSIKLLLFLGIGYITWTILGTEKVKRLLSSLFGLIKRIVLHFIQK